MPGIGSEKTEPIKRKRKRKPVYKVTVPDAHEATRSRAPRKASKPLAGDAPQTRKADTAKADKYKQSQPYVDKVQSARAARIRQDVKKRTGHGTSKSDETLRKQSDAQYFKTHNRLPEPRPAAKPRADPHRFEVDPSTGRARDVTPPKPKPETPPKSERDEPRSDKEIRKYLKSGTAPRSTKKKASGPFAGVPGLGDNVPPAIAAVINPGGKIPKVGATAASLLIGKEAARPLHAAAAAAQGKNPVKGFRKGHDTGSDVIKHYLTGGKTPKSGLARAAIGAAGFALDTKIDPLNRLKVNFRSPKEALERKAATQEARGKTEKAARSRDRAKTASTNRGVQVGVTRGGVLTGVKDMQTSGETTARINAKVGGSKLARKVHDSPKSQKVQKAFIPHHREPDVPADFHREHVKIKRKRTHEMHAADRYSQRRAQAFQRHSVKEVKKQDAPEDVVAAAERAPKGPTPGFKWTRVLSKEHKAVTETKRKERSAKTAVTRQQSRANFETNQQSKRIRDKLVAQIVRRDKAIEKRDVRGIGHEKAHEAHQEAQQRISHLDELIAEIKATPRLSRTKEDAALLAEARLHRRQATKFQRDLAARWGTYTTGEPMRVTKRGERPPKRTLKSHEASVQDLQEEIATYTGRKLNDAEHATLRRLNRRVGQFHQEANTVKVEPALRRYRKASADAKKASVERNRARKAFRNAWGEDPELGSKHPSSRRPVVGAASMYTDEQRKAVAERWHKADRAHALKGRNGEVVGGAQYEFKKADENLRKVAESQASDHAHGVPGVTELRHYDRANPNTLKNLDQARASVVARTAERKAAETTVRTGGKDGEAIPRHTKQFLEVTGKNKRGNDVSGPGARSWEDYLTSVPRHQPSDLSPAGAAFVRQHERETAAIRPELEKRGLIPDEGTPENYVHHMDSQQVSASKQADIDQFGQPHRQGGRAAKAGATEHRTDPRPIKTQHEHGPEKFETDLARIDANYLRDANRAIADHDYLQSLAGLGRPVTKGAHVGSTEAVFEITAKGIKEADDEIATAGGRLVILPRSVGMSEIRMRNGLKDPNIFGEAADEFHRMWKTTVTIYNMPFYQQRNLYDDTMRFWYGDGDLRSYREAGGLIWQARKVERGQRKLIPGATPSGYVKIGKDNIPKDQFIKEAESDGVLRGGAHANEFEHEGGAVDVRKRTPFREHVHNIGGVGEDIPRLATYLSARRRGMTRDQARDWTRVHHFDYTELTETERSLRRWIPFWTFTSRNTALQARTLITRPGKISQFQAFREEMAKLAGLPPDWDEQYLDDTQQKGMPIPSRWGTNKDGTPKIKLFFPSFSNTDLNRIPVGGSAKDVTLREWNMLMQQLSPLPKATIELFSNHSFFFREPIYRSADHPEAPQWVPAPPWIKKVPLLSKFVISDYQDPKSGKAITAWPAWMDYMVKQFPQTGFIATTTTPAKNGRGQTSGDRLFGQFSGIRRTGLDKSKGEIARLTNQIEANTVKRNNLRDRGRKADPKFDRFNSEEYQRLSDAITADTATREKLQQKVEKPRIDRRPKSIEQDIKDRVQRRLKNSTDKAIEERVRRRLQRVELKTGG